MSDQIEVVDELDDDVLDSLMQTAHDTGEEHPDRFPHTKDIERTFTLGHVSRNMFKKAKKPHQRVIFMRL